MIDEDIKGLIVVFKPQNQTITDDVLMLIFPIPGHSRKRNMERRTELERASEHGYRSGTPSRTME
jgi:hypothetical protein